MDNKNKKNTGSGKWYNNVPDRGGDFFRSMYENTDSMLDELENKSGEEICQWLESLSTGEVIAYSEQSLEELSHGSIDVNESTLFQFGIIDSNGTPLLFTIKTLYPFKLGEGKYEYQREKFRVAYEMAEQPAHVHPYWNAQRQRIDMPDVSTIAKQDAVPFFMSQAYKLYPFSNQCMEKYPMGEVAHREDLVARIRKLFGV